MSFVAIKHILAKDYKTFTKFDLSCRRKNVLVGPNNSGKSTILDALRISFDVLRFARRRNPVLKSQGMDGVCATYFVPQSAIGVDLRYCTRDFQDEPAVLDVKLESGARLVLKLNPASDVEAYLCFDGQASKSTSLLGRIFPANIVVVPTLSPLEQNEDFVQEKTVEANQYGRLASRNFRSYWYYRSADEFESLSDLISDAWGGIRLLKPTVERDGPSAVVRMYFRDGPKVREIQWAGFGFQVWMQTITHLLKADQNSILVLDEPDIYLHPELQHRLVRVVSKTVGQYFIATHSTEIINDVESDDIALVRPGARSAKRLRTDGDYSQAFKLIGSSENAQFARLARTQRVLYVEGDDRALYRRLGKLTGHETVFSDAETTFMRTDGFSNWSRVPSTSWVFNEMFDFEVKVAAIFDRDYRCDEEISKFLSSLKSEMVFCRVLPCKEIENILLVKAATIQAVGKLVDRAKFPAWQDTVIKVFDSSVEEVKAEVFAGRIGEKTSFYSIEHPKFDPKTLAVEENKAFEIGWKSEEFRLRVVPGKRVFSSISDRIQKEIFVTITNARVRLIPLSPGSQDMVFETCGGSDVPVMFRHACPLVI